MKAPLLAVVLHACGGDPGPATPASELADVVAVEVSGQPGAYTFAVTVRSPDTGCDLYANWWEVVDETSASLIYRRILGHSHVDEQPFTRTGGPMALAEDAPVVVRAHLAPGGYGGAVLRGTVATGLEGANLDGAWGADLADSAPQPDGCAF